MDNPEQVAREKARKAGRKLLIAAALGLLADGVALAAEAVGWRYLTLALAAVAVVLKVGSALNAVAAILYGAEAAKALWYADRLAPTVAAACFVVAAVFLGMAVYTAAEPQTTIDEGVLEDLREERDAAHEQAAAADDPETMQEHLREADAAERRIGMVEFVNGFTRYGLPLLSGFVGLVAAFVGVERIQGGLNGGTTA